MSRRGWSGAALTIALVVLLLAGCESSTPAAQVAVGTGRGDAGLTGVATSFQRGEAIEVGVRRAVAFGSSVIKVRLFSLRAQVVEQVWDDTFPVERDSNVLYFSMPFLPPAAYRLVTYLAMTEPMASVDFEVVP